MDPQREPGLQIGQVFMSFVNFAHREDALQLPAKTSLGEITVQIAVQAQLSEDETQALIRVGVRTDPEERYLYNLEIEMVAIVTENPGEENMTPREYVEGAMGAAMIFPFLREAVANITARGRFGPLWLKPVNIKRLTGGGKSPDADDTKQREARDEGA